MSRPANIVTTGSLVSGFGVGTGTGAGTFVGTISIPATPVEALPDDAKILKPLLLSSDYDKVCEQTSDKAFWYGIYNKATKAQREQEGRASELILANVETTSETGKYSEIDEDAHGEVFQYCQERSKILEALNIKIEQHNKISNHPANFGKVRIQVFGPFGKVRLAKLLKSNDPAPQNEHPDEHDDTDENDDEEMLKQSNAHWTILESLPAKLKGDLMKSHSLVAAIHTYRTHIMNADTSREHTTKGKLDLHNHYTEEFGKEVAKAIGKYNKRITGKTKQLQGKIAQLKEYKNIGLTYVPKYSDPGMDAETQEEEELLQKPDDQYFGQPDDPVPDSVKAIQSKMGGEMGCVRRLLLNPLDQQARDNFDRYQDLARAATVEAGHQASKFDINEANLASFWVQNILGSAALYNSLVNGTDSQDILQTYNSFRVQANDFVEKCQFPKNFADSLVPDIADLQASHLQLPPVDSPLVISQIIAMRARLEGPQGSLHTLIYLHTAAISGRTNSEQLAKYQEAAAEVTKVTHEIKSLTQQKCVTDNYSFTDLLLEELVRQADNMASLRENCRSNSGVSIHDDELDQYMVFVTKYWFSNGPWNGGIIGAVLGDSPQLLKQHRALPRVEPRVEPPVEEPQGTPDPSSGPFKYPKRQNKPDLLPSNKIDHHGVVKDIQSWISVGGRDKLLVKYQVPGKSKLAYLLLSGSDVKGTLSDFKQDYPGFEETRGRASDLESLRFKDVEVYTVAPTFREEHKDDYTNAPVTIVAVYIGDEPKWFGKSELVTKYGNQIRDKMETHVEAAGITKEYEGYVKPRKYQETVRARKPRVPIWRRENTTQVEEEEEEEEEDSEDQEGIDMSNEETMKLFRLMLAAQKGPKTRQRGGKRK
ncbi:uncharacterized protein BP5553_01134 [Venustampulla echinocandica]|uniref:Uncharacterized protein n=1 Tax=Venustampulla echinocandica TaxID=2656787 RepID=A0A370U063_9HELO|nr:uncharacterized protein BP5553_01134 [Venustampulla echinocandica]RDL41155.1 hypothetical protein BP5553_01134 [Venustampulla echinocandica]